MNEIEEFLRRAAALRAQQAQQRATPTPSVARPIPAAAPVVYDAEVMDAEVIEPHDVSGNDVAQYVQQHLSTRAFQERSQHAAERVRLADDTMEAHLHEAFEHRLGDLGATTSRAEDSTLDDAEEAAKKKPSAAPQIFRVLRSPAELRNAIIISELLTPPEHRW